MNLLRLRNTLSFLHLIPYEIYPKGLQVLVR